MSTLKKLLALTLALAMVLSVSVFAGNYSADTYADADKIAEDCKDAVELMYALEIMVGDGTNFNPEQAISRKEMAKIIYVVMNGGKDDNAANYKGNSIFSDVPADAWYNGYVNYCAMTKKIQGYNGKFDPDGTLTVAAAAKMLLTAIGYDAEAYGFVGPNWENNVLTVAHEAGLLADVSTVLTGAAYRQWVALMVKNSLGAYCYKTIAAIPGNGVLGNFWFDNAGFGSLSTITTFGEKYLNVAIVKGVVTSVTGATLVEGQTGVVIGGVKMTDTGLGIDALGQHYSVVCKVTDTDNAGVITKGAALSVRNTGASVVGVAAAKDVAYELTYSTVDNNEKNRYEYTVGDLTGKLNLDDKNNIDVKVLTVVYNGGKDLTAEKVTDTKTIKGYVDGVENRNDEVVAIDKDDDGDIDYVITTPVEYGYVNKVGTSKKYGDYVKVTAADGSDLEIKENATLYVDDLFTADSDELAKGNFVKYTWNIDEKLFDVVALEGESAAKFESRKISKNQYTFAGETYGLAANAFEVGKVDMINVKGTGVLGEKFTVIYDGDMLVWAGEYDTSLTDMSSINEQLAVLIEADVRNNDLDNNRQVKLLTIDGEIAWYAYDVAGAASNKNTAANKIKWSAIAPDWTSDTLEPVDPITGEGAWDKLVIVHTNDDGEVWLETVVDPLNIKGADKHLVQKVAAPEGELKVTATKATLTLEDESSYRVAYENLFFANVDGEYCVIDMSDLEADEYDVEATALVNTQNERYNSIVGGYLVIDSQKAGYEAEEGYLVVTDYAEWKIDSAYNKVTALINGAEEEVEIKVNKDQRNLVMKSDYRYFTYVVDKDGVYTLTDLVHVKKNIEVTPDEEMELWYKSGSKFYSVDFDGYEYVSLKVVTNLQNENDSELKHFETTVEFSEDAAVIVDYIAECEALTADDDYTYDYTYKFWTVGSDDLKGEEDLFIMVVTVDMVANETID